MTSLKIFNEDFKHLSYGYISALSYELNILRSEPFALCPTFPDCTMRHEDFNDCENIIVVDVLHNNISFSEALRLLTTKCRNLIICAHGENGHIRLPDSVLCSHPPHDYEANISGEAIENGCSKFFCRRLRSKEDRIIHCEDLYCKNIYILSCNGACINGELFDTSSSLVREFLRNGAESILACLECQEYMRSDVDMVKSLILEGISGSEIAMLLNQISYRRNHTAPFCLFVSRSYSFEKTTLKTIKFKNEIKLNSSSRCLVTENLSSSFYLIDIVLNREVQYFLGASVLLLLNRGNENMIKIHAASEKIVKAITDLNDILVRVKFMETFFTENNCRSIENEIRLHHSVLISEMMYLEDLYRLGICDRGEFMLHLEKISREVQNIQKSIMKFILENNSVHLIERIKYSAIFYKGCEKICNRCHYPMQRFTTVNKFMYIDVCGLCGISCIANVGCEIDFYISYHEDKSATFNLHVNISLSNNSLLYFELNDKARGKTVQRILLHADLSNKIFSFPIKTELIIGKDLHTYRAIILSDLRIIYLRGRFTQLEK